MPVETLEEAGELANGRYDSWLLQKDASSSITTSFNFSPNSLDASPEDSESPPCASHISRYLDLRKMPASGRMERKNSLV